jgi:hypothetical protein
MTTLSPGDERRHPSGPEPLWSESWYLDFVAAGGALAGYVRLGLLPNQGRAWWWAYLVGDGRPLVAVRDHDVALPTGRGLEVRAEGLWAELTCETPFEHWTVGMEAFGVALESAAEAVGAERGQRVPVGLDLEWEAAGPVYPYSLTTRYEQACRVHGEVLLGAERVEVDGWGQRDHSWGVRDWWALAWCWASGRLDDGTAFHALKPFVEGLDLHEGFLVGPAAGHLTPLERVAVETATGPDGLPSSSALVAGPLGLRLDVVAPAPVPLDAPDGRRSVLARALCRVGAADGRAGWAWGEWNTPPRSAPSTAG